MKEIIMLIFPILGLYLVSCNQQADNIPITNDNNRPSVNRLALDGHDPRIDESIARLSQDNDYEALWNNFRAEEPILSEIIRDAGVPESLTTTTGGQMFLRALENREDIEKLGGGELRVFGAIPFQDSTGKNTVAYEYILMAKNGLVGSVYEVLSPPITYQDDRMRFFTPHFSLAGELAKNIGYSTGNTYIHDGNCIVHTDQRSCLDEETPEISHSGTYLTGGLDVVEEKVAHYLGRRSFYFEGPRGFTYFSPQNRRVYTASPGEIMTYDDLSYIFPQ